MSCPPEQVSAFGKAIESATGDFVTRLKNRGLPANEALEEYKAALGK